MRQILFFVLLVSSAGFGKFGYAADPADASRFPFSRIPYDSFYWLEDVRSPRSLSWVSMHNERIKTKFESDPLFQKLQKQAEEILLNKDRTFFGRFRKGYFWSFIQNEAHPKGIWAWASREEYQKPQPIWQTALDFDALSQSEHEDWVYKGGVEFHPSSDRSLFFLSRGGGDAVVVREFDNKTHRFIEGGFTVPEAKTQISPLDEDHLFIGSDFGPGSLTNSGYARVIKLWQRGTPLETAKIQFEGLASDMSVSSMVLRDGTQSHVLFVRSIDFFNNEVFLQQEVGLLHKLPLPSSAEFLGLRGGKVYAQLKDPLNLEGKNFSSDSIIRFDLNALDLRQAELIFSARPKQSIDEVIIRSDRVYVKVLDDVRNKVLELRPDKTGAWTARNLPFPQSGMISLSFKEESDATGLTTMTYTDHLTPATQYIVHDEDESFRLEPLKSAQAYFDSSRFEVVQNHARSADGTAVPYFLIKRKNMIFDGRNTTILYGYGGFEVSLAPPYSGIIGKLWLEHGGVYVIANIRGGGEFGTGWHQAAIGKNRQRAFDDFAAVAEDLIRRKVTSPAHLGINGGSNGGLLVGTVMVQRPELFNAVHSEVPLLDMVRYSSLFAGASWMGEYGDPSDAQDCENLLSYSPYHRVRSDVRYPMALFTTSTADDRVHPSHARKMVARMTEQGHRVHYYENTTGGHAGSATPKDSARGAALKFTYFSRQLR